MIIRIMVALLAVILIPAQFAIAKAPTAEVTVTGPELDKPLHTSDDAIIAANVWTGNFIDWEAGEVGLPRADAPLYQVHFWVQLDANDIQMKYVLDFQWLEEANRAVVCLPGPQSIWYRTNVYTILRTGQDGNCYYAERDWGLAVQAALRRSF